MRANKRRGTGMITERDCPGDGRSRSPSTRFVIGLQKRRVIGIYLDANSMGAMPRDVPDRLERLCQAWLGRGQTKRLDQVRLAGCSSRYRGCDRTLHRRRGEGRNRCRQHLGQSFQDSSLCLGASSGAGTVILTERANFPTDIYIAEGLSRLLGEPRG